MSTLTKFNCFVENLAEKVHNLGSDQLTIALSNTAPSAANTVLADIAEIAYTNLSTRNVTTISSAQTSGTYKLDLTDLTLTASGAVATFRYIILYNSTTGSGNLIGYSDYGSAVTMSSGETFLINFDNSAGAITIT
jgi:hypothetical protein